MPLEPRRHIHALLISIALLAMWTVHDRDTIHGGRKTIEVLRVGGFGIWPAFERGCVVAPPDVAGRCLTELRPLGAVINGFATVIGLAIVVSSIRLSAPDQH